MAKTGDDDALPALPVLRGIRPAVFYISREEYERVRDRAFRMPLMQRYFDEWDAQRLSPSANHDPGDEDRSER